MDLDELIRTLVAKRQLYGNLEVFDEDYYAVDGVSVENTKEGQFDEDWNMPERFIRLDSNR